MEKNPKTCGNSADVHGIYFCRILHVPCVRARKCALQISEEMADALKELLLDDRAEVSK